MPITWKNINQPNFSASNQLLISGGEQMANSIGNLGDRFVAEGDRQKAINTDKAVAAARALQGLENYGQQRADLMAGLGKNIDRTAVADALDQRLKVLQGNDTFADQQAITDFKIGNQQQEFDTAQTLKNLQAQKARVDIASGKLDYNTTLEQNTPEYKAAVRAEEDRVRKIEQANKEALARIKNNGGSSSQKGFDALLESVPNRWFESTNTTKGILQSIDTQFSDLPAKKRRSIIAKHIDPSAWGNPFDKDALIKELNKARLEED